MLSEQVARADSGFAGLIMSAADFHAIGPTQDRYELINGVVMMSPSPTPQHWRFVQEILFQLETFARSKGGLDTYAETDLYIDAKTVFRPDLCVYARRPSKLVPQRLTEPPDVVVEINSPGNKSYDLITKHTAYERFGVKEYWSIDPFDPNDPPGLRVRAWRADRGRFVEILGSHDSLASAAIPGFSLDIRPLREMTQPG